MLTGLSSMQLAQEKLRLYTESSYIVNASACLDSAVELAEKYHKLQWSIVWIDSKPARKISLRAELNILAYDCYSNFCLCCSWINKQADSQAGKNTPPLWWNEVIISLTLADSCFHQEHLHEIGTKQLKLNF
jgi:hypothetical protein